MLQVKFVTQHEWDERDIGVIYILQELEIEMTEI